MIDRKKWVRRHNTEYTDNQLNSANYVGNGELAYGFDITGLQTFYSLYESSNNPLCTMSQWGWHKKEGFDYNQYEMTSYNHPKGEVTYAVEPKEGNEAVYHWLRENPHRFNLARVGLYLNGKLVEPKDIVDIKQTFDFYHGRAISQFKIKDHVCQVITLCDSDTDTLGFFIKSSLLKTHELSIALNFPYGSSNMSGSDWNHEELHTTEILDVHAQSIKFSRKMDQTSYFVTVRSSHGMDVQCACNHRYQLVSSEAYFKFTVNFSEVENEKSYTFEKIEKRSKVFWENYWRTVGAVDCSKVKDTRGLELERRVVLSLFQSTIHGSGSRPPQETGLACNSWYGKFHLEMHPLHSLYMPLWSKGELLLKSISWYKTHLKDAIDNAKRNGYKGAKWPKMVADDGIDSPSWIATLLIWQQPHILYMLEVLYICQPNHDFLVEYEELVTLTGDYMVDYSVYNESTQCYELVGPLIPVQEEHEPIKTLNPSFELAYWSFGLELGSRWVGRLPVTNRRTETIRLFTTVAERMAPLPKYNGLYIAHENCQNTFESFNKDHPSMLMTYGFIPNKKIEVSLMQQTYEAVMEHWDFASLWGWDFAMMAMTAIRLKKPEWAIEALLRETPKNTYVENGHNYQQLRTDLPVYLPGNGSFLLAVGMMAMGYEDQNEGGFEELDGWKDIQFEGLRPLPY